jgi:hypothetical protein
MIMLGARFVIEGKKTGRELHDVQGGKKNCFNRFSSPSSWAALTFLCFAFFKNINFHASRYALAATAADTAEPATSALRILFQPFLGST